MSTSSRPFEASVPSMDAVAAAHWRALPRRASPWLHEEIGARMAERLACIKLQPQAWMSWAPLLGGLDAHRTVVARYPQAQLCLAGPQAAQAEPLLRTGPGQSEVWQGVKRWLGWGQASVVAEGAQHQPVDMVWANMALHQVPQPQQLLSQWHQALRVDGFVMFSCLGPDTLREVRAVFAQQGWPVPGSDHTDMHDWGDMLVEVGFAEPVMDMEKLTLTYPNAERLLQDLRETGRNLHPGRYPSWRGKGYRQRLCAALEAGLPRNAQGHLQITVEVVYGHAMKAAPKVKLSPSSTISVQDMKAILKHSQKP